jgi:hypothetical protein
MKPRTTLVAVLLLLAATHARAEVPLRLEGQLKQGALVIGHTQPGAVATLDDKTVSVDPTGAFVLGFARDAPVEATLSLTLPGGRKLVRKLAIAQRSYQVQRIDGIAQHLVEPPPEVMKRLEEEYFLVRRARETVSALPFFRTGFIWPAQGRVSGVYGSQRIMNGKPLRPHYGVDVAAPPGAPVRASAAGTVTLAHPDLYFSGKSVIIDHGLGVSTVYIHLQDIAVRNGDSVRQGQQIGTVGSSGRASGPHLHWGLNWFQEYLDPGTVVGPMPKR